MNDAYAIALQPQRERFEFFRGVVDRVFCPMQVQPSLLPGQTFGGSVAVTDFRGIRLARVATSACFVRRRAEDIACISSPGYLVKFQLKGQSLWTQRGRQLQLTPGDFVICSTTEPYSLRFLEAYSMPVIGLSNQAMHDLTPHPNRFLGVRMNGEEADCGLLSSFVSQVVVRMGQLSEPMLGRVEANILDLLGAVLTTRSDKTPMSAAMQLRRIKVYVRSHLRDPRLSPAMIATEFGISAIRTRVVPRRADYPRKLHSLAPSGRMPAGARGKSRRRAVAHRPGAALGILRPVAYVTLLPRGIPVDAQGISQTRRTVGSRSSCCVPTIGVER
jgi:AraC family transcriptional activator of tynA and feaB